MGSEIISLHYPKSLDENRLIDAIAVQLATISPSVSIKEKKPDTHLCVSANDLVSVIVILIAEPFLNAFLKELGAESARSLKSQLVKLLSKVRKKNFMTISVDKLEEAAEILKEGGGAKAKSKKLAQLGRRAPLLEIRVIDGQREKPICIIPPGARTSDLLRIFSTLSQSTRSANKKKKDKKLADGESPG